MKRVLIMLLLLLSLTSCASTARDESKTEAATRKPVTAVTRAPPISYDHIIGNKSSKKYHLPSCSFLPDEKNQIVFSSADQAEDYGYEPCQKCCD